MVGTHELFTLIDTMAFDKKLLAQGRYNNTTNNDLYTCPADKIAHIDSLVGVSISEGTTIRVFHNDAGGAGSQDNMLTYDTELVPGSTEVILKREQGVTVAAGGKIIVQNSVANDVCWSLYGTEEDV